MDVKRLVPIDVKQCKQSRALSTSLLSLIRLKLAAVPAPDTFAAMLGETIRNIVYYGNGMIMNNPRNLTFS
jgi:hypothetical protein